VSRGQQKEADALYGLRYSAAPVAKSLLGYVISRDLINASRRVLILFHALQDLSAKLYLTKTEIYSPTQHRSALLPLSQDPASRFETTEFADR